MADFLPLPDRQYSVIYADPPWEYRQHGTTKKSRGTALKQYQTMTTTDICNLPVRKICGGGAACFLWATFPNITEGIRVLEAWGFQYKTAAFVWVKKNAKSGTNFWGMGAYTRANANASPVTVLTPSNAPWNGEGEDPMEAEKIEEALLASGYFSLAVPMSYEYQDYMRTYCAEYKCPYPLALAVAETETNFDMEAVGAAGEVGIMQLNPGPSGSYHAELEEATGMDPATPSGNIAAGCYLLGKYMEDYGDPHKAAMAYNMGVSGARNAWEAGITSTEYSTAVVEAMERWEVTVNAWNGI